MVKETPQHFQKAQGEALAQLRFRRGMSQRELAAASGLQPSSLSRYESGEDTIKPAVVKQLLDRLDYGPGALRATHFWMRAVDGAAAGAESYATEREEVTLQAGHRMADALHRLGGYLETIEPPAWVRPPVPASPDAVSDRERARELRQRLARYPETRWARLLRYAPDLHHGGLCDLLCDESIETAADDANRALRIAEQSLELALRLYHGERRNDRRALALFHVSNAWRVKGDLRQAAEVSRQAQALWDSSPRGRTPAWETRVLMLRGALLRDQGHPAEALGLFERAVALPATGDRPALFLHQARALAELGDRDGSLAVLAEAEAALPDGKPRLRLAILFRRALTLLELERFADAAAALPDLRDGIARLGHRLDHARGLWLEGRIARGLGRLPEALGFLREARRELAAQEIAYDQALLDLEIAELLDQLGRSDEVRQLASRLVSVFESQGTPRQAEAALRLAS